MTSQAASPLLVKLDAAIEGLNRLTGAGEDHIWRPADKARQALVAAREALREVPTCFELLARLKLSGETEQSRLAVMAQNPAANYHWTRQVGQFTAGEVREALRQEARFAVNHMLAASVEKECGK